FLSFNGGITRQDEGRLRKIHLTRESLHFSIIQTARVRENSERIAREWCLRENVNLDELVSAIRHKNLSNLVPDLVTGCSYSSWRRHQTSVSLRPLGPRSTYCN